MGNVWEATKYQKYGLYFHGAFHPTMETLVPVLYLSHNNVEQLSEDYLSDFRAWRWGQGFP